MAKFTIETTQIEQGSVLKALEGMSGAAVSVAVIARAAGLPQSRTRYALLDLEEKGTIEKVPVKAFNRHYIRYAYNILKK